MVTTTSVPEGTLSENYDVCVTTSGGLGNRTFTLLSGSLPPGLSLQTNGCFNGSPTTGGVFNVIVQVTDQSSPPQSDAQPLVIEIAVHDRNSGGNDTGVAVAFRRSGGLSVEQVIRAGLARKLER